jgi:hypothetical protein
VVRWKKVACAIFMKFCTFELFFNQESNGTGFKSEKLHLVGHIESQRSICSKIDNGRIAPRWKAYDSGNSPASTKINFNKRLGVKLDVKYRSVIEKDIFIKFDPKYDLQRFVKIKFC